MLASPDPAPRLRILVYANVERDEAGGAQAVVRALRDYLSEQGHQVSTGWTNEKVPGQPISGEWVEHFPIRFGQQRWLHLPTIMRLLARLLRERPDVINIHFASPSARYFYALAPWLGYRTVLTCHGSDVLRPLPQDLPHLTTILSGADAVTAVSQDIADRIESSRGGKPGRPVAVIANGVDTRFWHPASPRPHKVGIIAGRIVAVGRLEPVKGYDLMIEALARLRAAGSQASLILVGDGSQRAELEKQARDAGIDDRVIFAGSLPREEVRARLQAAHLFVLPSRSEGTPLALLEAMATGKTCIATEVGGVPASVGKAARLVPPDNAAALTKAIADLLSDPQACSILADRARERALGFSVGKTHHAYEALMLSLASAKRV